jgi:hypothetical protein
MCVPHPSHMSTPFLSAVGSSPRAVQLRITPRRRKQTAPMPSTEPFSLQTPSVWMTFPPSVVVGPSRNHAGLTERHASDMKHGSAS